MKTFEVAKLKQSKCCALRQVTE